VSGRFFVDKRERRTSEASYDRALAERLWTVSTELTIRRSDTVSARLLEDRVLSTENTAFSRELPVSGVVV
jgi:hypothetical protein